MKSGRKNHLGLTYRLSAYKCIRSGFVSYLRCWSHECKKCELGILRAPAPFFSSKTKTYPGDQN